MFPESLRWRIQIWHGFLLAAVLTGFAIAAYRYQAANDLRRLDADLRQRVRLLADGLPAPHGPGGPGAREFRLPASRAALFEPADASGHYYIVWRRDGSVWARSGGAPSDIGMPASSSAHPAVQVERSRGSVREVYIFTPPGECLLAGRSTAPEQAALREYARWLAAISGGVLVLGLAVGWWIATRAIRPIGVITATARRIAAGELSKRIPARETKSEFGRLSATLNETFAQLEESFARQSRFTADAAHELRTPVSIILAQAQRVLARERDAATYQQTLETCVKAARRLQQLTESLLELTVHDAGAVAVKKDDCDIADTVRETAALLQPLADDRRIALMLDLAPAPCRADANRIAQVILNLLTNALDHTPAEGSITVRTDDEAGNAILSVTDTGPGIADEHLPRIFDRFYRTDDSRNRRTGGAGLGLAICKAIADAHDAKLEVSSVPGKGSTFTLRIPARQTHEAAAVARA
jgi:heavy metal sensor kinase